MLHNISEKIYYGYIMHIQGVLTPGKFSSSLALVWTKYNVDFIFNVWYGSLSHCSFSKRTRNCKQNHTCAKVIHLLVHPFNRVRLERTETTSSAGSRYGCLVRTRVRVLYSHLPKGSAPKGEMNLSSNQTRQV